MATGARLRALPALEMERLGLFDFVPRETEASGSQLIKVTRVRLLLCRQHTALTRADAGASKLRTFRQRNLGFLRERAEAHVGYEQRDVEFHRPVCTRPDNEIRANLLVVQQRQLVQLRHNELDVVPGRQLAPRHAHRRRRPVMAHLRQAFAGELANELDVRLVLGAGRILKRALVRASVVRLRMRSGPRCDFVFVDADLTVLYPTRKLGQYFRVVVFGDACVVPVVPTVNTADEIVAIDVAV